MAIYLGNTNLLIGKIKMEIDSLPKDIQKIYLGNTLVFPLAEELNNYATTFNPLGLQALGL